MTLESGNEVDRAHFSPALFGFYACCAFISIGAAVFFFALFVMTKEGYGSVPSVMKVVGAVFMLGGIPGSFVCLNKARKKGQDVVDEHRRPTPD